MVWNLLRGSEQESAVDLQYHRAAGLLLGEIEVPCHLTKRKIIRGKERA